MSIWLFRSNNVMLSQMEQNRMAMAQRAALRNQDFHQFIGRSFFLAFEGLDHYVSDTVSSWGALVVCLSVQSLYAIFLWSQREQLWKMKRGRTVLYRSAYKWSRDRLAYTDNILPSPSTRRADILWSEPKMEDKLDLMTILINHQSIFTLCVMIWLKNKGL